MQEERDKALATLRVVAIRLGIDWKQKELQDPHALAAAVDSALVRVLAK